MAFLVVMVIWLVGTLGDEGAPFPVWVAWVLGVGVLVVVALLGLRSPSPSDPGVRVARVHRPGPGAFFSTGQLAVAGCAVLAPVVVFLGLLVAVAMGDVVVPGLGAACLFAVAVILIDALIGLFMARRILRRPVAASDDEDLFWADVRTWFLLEEVAPLLVAVPFLIVLAMSNQFGALLDDTGGMWARAANIGLAVGMLTCLAMTLLWTAGIDAEPRFIGQLWSDPVDGES